MNEIRKLQMDPDFLESEGDRYCLTSPLARSMYTEEDLHNHANFCILQTIKALKEEKIDSKIANFIINKIDTLLYSVDMLGVEKVIEKLNKEIVEEELHIPHFNYICFICEDLYDSYR